MSSRLKSQPTPPDRLTIAVANAYKTAMEESYGRKLTAKEFDKLLGSIKDGPDITEDTTQEELEFEYLSQFLEEGIPYERAAESAKDLAAQEFRD